MRESKMFTEDQMVAWEKPQRSKPGRISSITSGKMARLKTILASHRKTFAVQGCSPSSTTMMFALLQDQHKAQLEAMAAANKQAMDAMLERMNELSEGQGKAADKVTTTIPNSNIVHASNTTNCKKKVCATCGKLIVCKPQTCYELESNASKRYPGWKSSKVDSATV